MQLIGQFDSPYVRRVGIAMSWYGFEFEHRPLSVFAHAEELAAVNPLRKVPTLVLDDGTVLTDSFVCLEVIDELAAGSNLEIEKGLLLPRKGRMRIDGLRLCGFALGLMEKTVALIYERVVRDNRRDAWIARCTEQFLATLAYLDAERARSKGEFLVGSALTHADIALSCAFVIAADALPDLADAGRWPNVSAHSSHFESLPEFARCRQRFDIPES
jgi:glutathione S-transferase